MASNHGGTLFLYGYKCGKAVAEYDSQLYYLVKIGITKFHGDIDVVLKRLYHGQNALKKYLRIAADIPCKTDKLAENGSPMKGPTVSGSHNNTVNISDVEALQSFMKEGSLETVMLGTEETADYSDLMFAMPFHTSIEDNEAEMIEFFVRFRIGSPILSSSFRLEVRRHVDIILPMSNPSNTLNYTEFVLMQESNFTLLRTLFVHDNIYDVSCLLDFLKGGSPSWETHYCGQDIVTLNVRWKDSRDVNQSIEVKCRAPITRYLAEFTH